MARICIANKECTCHVCGTAFLAKYRTAKYCNDACRHDAELSGWHRRRADRGVPTLGHSVRCTKCAGDIVDGTGRHRYCPACRKVEEAEKSARYRARNPQTVSQSRREFDQRRRLTPERREAIRFAVNKHTKKVRSTYRGNLDHRMSQLVRSGLRGKKRGRKWEDLVGYTIESLTLHIERQFVEGMTWGNMGEWHIDHIIPRSYFRYEAADDAEFKACWAITNLRPLWSGENISKGAKRTLLI